MRSIREVLRLKYGLGRTHRQIAAALGIANSTVSLYVSRAVEAGLSWPLPEGLDDTALEAALFPPQPPSRDVRPKPDWAEVHRELQRHKGMTLQLLWLEYRNAHPDGYAYSWYCKHYRQWRGAYTWCCVRPTGRARRPSSTTRARSSRSWTRIPATCGA